MSFVPSHSGVAEMLFPDHVMVLLDDDTYREVTTNEFLPTQFSRVKPKTADSSVAGRYSTLGLAGRNTLLELFVGTVPGPRRYTAGLVFSFELPGAVPRAREALLARAGIPAHHQLVERAEPDGTPQPWYDLLAPDLGADSPLLLMLNQVTPEYYASLGARPGPNGELSRREYLNAVLGNAAPDPAGDGPEKLLGDLVGVTVRLRAARADRLTAVLTTLGYRERDGALHGPAFAVTVDVDDAAPEGVTEVTMTLTRTPEAPEEFRFGKGSRLLLDPAGSARWVFTPVD
jgi:hypothetical protein